MRTRTSPRNQERLYRSIGSELQRAAQNSTQRLRTCGHGCDCRDGECPCSTPGECPPSWMRDEVQR